MCRASAFRVWGSRFRIAGKRGFGSKTLNSNPFCIRAYSLHRYTLYNLIHPSMNPFMFPVYRPKPQNLKITSCRGFGLGESLGLFLLRLLFP